MTQTKPLNPKESLELITKVINQTKENIKIQSFYYLLWGWLVTIAALSNYLILIFTDFKFNYLPWFILMPLGVIISMVYAKKDKNKKPYVTHIEVFLKYLWMVLGVSFIIAGFISLSLKIHPAIFILLICGIGTLVSGLILKYNPLTIGGFIFLILAILTIYVNTSTILLINAIAMVTGYLIPAYLLKNSKK